VADVYGFAVATFDAAVAGCDGLKKNVHKSTIAVSAMLKDFAAPPNAAHEFRLLWCRMYCDLLLLGYQPLGSSSALEVPFLERRARQPSGDFQTTLIRKNAAMDIYNNIACTVRRCRDAL
jgi:hypothetical protein